MDYPELNRELLIKVVDHALSAENWRQEKWYSTYQTSAGTCGTAYCIAGFVAIEFDGWEPVDDDMWRCKVTKDGVTRFIPDVAEEELGLTGREASILFASGNTRNDIQRITRNILEGKYRCYPS